MSDTPEFYLTKKDLVEAIADCAILTAGVAEIVSMIERLGNEAIAAGRLKAALSFHMASKVLQDYTANSVMLAAGYLQGGHILPESVEERVLFWVNGMGNPTAVTATKRILATLIEMGEAKEPA